MPTCGPTVLEPFDFRSPFSDTSGRLTSWAQRWITQLVNHVNAVTPGPYANDAAAKAAGVSIGRQYYLDSGQVYVRRT